MGNMGTYNDYIKEGDIPGHVKKTNLDAMITITKQMKESVCNIIGSVFTGTGFFCVIQNMIEWNSPLFYVLMTNNHILGKEDIKPNKKIKISLDNGNENLEILIDNSRKTFTSEIYDVTIIEMKQNDGIQSESFLEIDKDIYKDNFKQIFKKKSIYLLHYPKGIEICKSEEIIRNIREDNYTIEHYCDSTKGSSGGPLINLNNCKVIGIHKGFYHNKINLGTILRAPIEKFYEQLNKDIQIIIKNTSMSVQEIFQSKDFNDLSVDEFKNKFKNHPDFQELLELKNIHFDLINGPSVFSKIMLDFRGNNINGWSINEKRGNKYYDPPVGWIGIGLRAFDYYENNIWLGKNNSNGEWIVAYHGVAREQSSDMVKKIIGLIYKNTFKAGPCQAHSNCLDINHPGKRIGVGVTVTPSIKVAESYAGISEINGIKYKTVLMVRVKPDVVRKCNCITDYWVVNGTTDEIRVYRILFKRYY